MGSDGEADRKRLVVVCPVAGCGKEFDRKFNMKAHLRKHTGDRPYKCSYPQCNIRYMWRSSLANHIRRHEELNMSRKVKREESSEASAPHSDREPEISETAECCLSLKRPKKVTKRPLEQEIAEDAGFCLSLKRLHPDAVVNHEPGFTEEVIMTRPVFYCRRDTPS